jgi:hypothetical protein
MDLSDLRGETAPRYRFDFRRGASFVYRISPAPRMSLWFFVDGYLVSKKGDTMDDIPIIYIVSLGPLSLQIQVLSQKVKTGQFFKMSSDHYVLPNESGIRPFTQYIFQVARIFVTLYWYK